GAVASLGDDVFVADSARLAGRVAAAAGASIWYGCRLDARRGTIVLGAQANVQDNSVLVAGEGDLSIGEGSTIGHNVELASCTIGARSLVGIGSRIAPGSVIADDAFVAAGARTTPGQVLEGGFVWAGAPARKLGSLDERKREIVRITAEVYAGYGRAMRHAVPA
ncbi:MAG TPA: gamma carbonic anhydrase family protein, partial [Ideonella sp.]|nr:gamma carbonic anhydrase family protein [Ideonella sp.]